MKKYLVLPLIFPLMFYYLLKNFKKAIPATWEDLMMKMGQLIGELEENDKD